MNYRREYPKPNMLDLSFLLTVVVPLSATWAAWVVQRIWMWHLTVVVPAPSIPTLIAAGLVIGMWTASSSGDKDRDRPVVGSGDVRGAASCVRARACGCAVGGDVVRCPVCRHEVYGRRASLLMLVHELVRHGRKARR